QLIVISSPRHDQYRLVPGRGVPGAEFLQGGAQAARARSDEVGQPDDPHPGSPGPEAGTPGLTPSRRPPAAGPVTGRPPTAAFCATITVCTLTRWITSYRSRTKPSYVLKNCR